MPTLILTRQVVSVTSEASHKGSCHVSCACRLSRLLTFPWVISPPPTTLVDQRKVKGESCLALDRQIGIRQSNKFPCLQQPDITNILIQ